MDKPKKGIERHEALIPLSHHHHHALYLALRLKRMGTDKSDLTEEEMKKEVERLWKLDGNQHFRDEDEILLPAYAQYASLDHPDITEMLLEHVKLRSYVKQILTADDNLIPLMNEYGELLEKHVRREERIVFPMIEKALPEDELQRMKPYLHIGEYASEE